MTQQIINIGTTANDGEGDPLRVAFQKVNNNFTEVYGIALGAGTAAPPDGAVQYRATNNFDAIAYNAGVWVVFGEPQRYYTSSDGQIWAAQTAPSANTIRAVRATTAMGFMAVGDAGTILYSDDLGTTWTVAASGTTQALRDLHFDPLTNIYIAVGDGGTILRSSNKTTWTQIATGYTDSLYGLAYNPLLLGYVAVGANGRILTSLTGVTWLQQISGTVNTLFSVTSDATRYVATGQNATVLVSQNGVLWQPRTVLVNGNLMTAAQGNIVSNVSGNITVTPTLFAAGSAGLAFYSQDANATVWIQSNTGTQSLLQSTVWTGNTFWTVGSNGSIVSSNTLTSWSNTSVRGGFTANANFSYNENTGTLSAGNITATANLQANIVNSNIVGANILAVTGVSNLGAVGNVRISGGSNGYILSTDGNSNLTWTPGGVTVAEIANIQTVRSPNTYISATAALNGVITVGNAYVFTVGQPVTFQGNVFGNLQTNVTYFVSNILSSSYMTVSATPGGPTFSLTDGNGSAVALPVDTRITTAANNLFTEGVAVTITDVGGMTELNGQQFYANVHTSNIFSIYYDANLRYPVSSLNFTPYTLGGRAVAPWGNGGGGGGNANVTVIPAIYFEAPVSGNNQQFSNFYLTSYQSASDLTVFLNGSLLEDGFYTLSGGTLTVTTPLQAGDSVDIIRQFAGNVIQPGGNGTPGGNNTELQYNSNGVFAGIPTVTFSGGNLSLGNVSNVRILGGANTQVLATDGTGNLSWQTVAANVATVPQVNFTVAANGFNQSFSNAFLASYTSNTEMTVFTNGVLLLEDNYTLTGDTITVLTPLNTGDTVTVARSAAANVISVNAYSNSNVQAFLNSGTLAGNIIPSGNKVYDLGSATQRWRDLYLSNNTIYLGDAQLSSDGPNLLYDGQPIVSSTVAGDVTLAGNLTAGNVIAANSVQTPLLLVGGLPLERSGLSNLTYDSRPLVSTNESGDTSITGNLTANNLVGNGLVVSGGATITGNLAVTGNVTYNDANVLVVESPIIELGGGPNGAPLTVNDGFDRGTLLHYYTTQPVDAFMGWKNDIAEFVFVSNAVDNNNVITVNQLGNVRAQTFLGNFIGNFSGNIEANIQNAVNAVNVTGANQPNITGLGTLTSLTVVGGPVNLGSIVDLTITGGSNGQVLTTAGNGELYWSTANGGGNGGISGITVGTLNPGNTFINSFPNITSLGFDSDSGFDVVNLGNGVAKVAMNSTFKYWEVDGAPGLEAQGLDTVNFIAGNNVTITANALATPQSIRFDATQTTPGGAADQIQYNSNGVFAGIATLTYSNSNLYMGNIANIKIDGGSNGYGLITDGNGNLTFGEFVANVTSIPAMYWTVPTNGNNQIFSNTYLGSYTSNTDITVFINGSLLENSRYYLNGNELTIGTPLGVGDTVEVIRQFAANVIEYTGVPAGNTTQIQYNIDGNFAAEAGFTYDPLENLMTVANVTVTGRVRSSLVPNGSNSSDLGQAGNRWRDLYLGNSSVVYIGNQQITASNAYTQIGNVQTGVLLANSANTGNTTVTDLAVTGTANLGPVGNVRITEGTSGQYLQTDGSGNLAWSSIVFPDLLSVAQIGAGNVLSNVVSNVSTISFATASDFTVESVGNGVAKVIQAGAFKSINVNGANALNANGPSTLNFIAGNNVTLTANADASPQSLTFSAATAALQTGANGTVQAVLSANGQLSVPGNLISNTIVLRLNNQEFSSRQGYAVNTFTNLPGQVIIAWPDPNITAIDMILISTDSATNSRQVSKISVAVYGNSVNYNETSTIINNLAIVDWNVVYVPNQVELQADILYNRTMTHRIEATVYREL